MAARPDPERLVPVADLRGDDATDTRRLQEMHEKALSFVQSHHWAPPVAATYFGDGIGGVVAVFLVTFAARIQPHGDDMLWVVVGDLPSAYLVVDQVPDALAALHGYCDLMQDWADAVDAGRPLASVFPVAAEPTAAMAAALRIRVKLLRDRVLPHLR